MHMVCLFLFTTVTDTFRIYDPFSGDPRENLNDGLSPGDCGCPEGTGCVRVWPGWICLPNPK